MIEIKTLGGKLNSDDSLYRLPPNDYIEALNVTHDAVEGSNDEIITPIVSNRSVPYVFPVLLLQNTSFITLGISTNAQTVFSGSVNTGLIINVWLTELSSGNPILIGTYTTKENDTLNDVASGLWTSMLVIGIVTFVGPITHTLFYHYNNTLYVFNRIEIFPDASENKCIGSYANTLRNTTINFIYNISNYHSVLEYDNTSRTITKIFENITDSGGIDILGFTATEKINSINVFNRDEGDLLYFLDSLGRPTQMDITLFKAGAYTPVTRDIIDKAKKPPLVPASVIYDNDTSIRSNDLRKRLFRFKYRWIYDDFEKSTFSPISIVPLPIGIISDAYTNVVTNNNVIQLIAYTGDKNVKSVEIGVSYVENSNDWSDFLSVTVIDKVDLLLMATSDSVFSDGTNETESTTFSGTPTTGTVVRAYLTLLPNTKTLVGSYTVVDGDTTTDIAVGLTANMVTVGIVTGAVSFDNVVLYSWSSATYSFNGIEITQGADNDNTSFQYSFYNDSTYPAIDIEESIELFDYTPQKANAQEMPNGNTLAYIGITEGYDKDTTANSTITINTTPAGNGAIGSLDGVVTLGITPATIAVSSILFSGVPATETVITIRLKNITTNTIVIVATYTTVPGDTIGNASTGVIGGLIASALSIGLVDNAQNPSLNKLNIIYQAEGSSTNPHFYSNYTDLIITAPATSTQTNSLPTWKWSTARSIARAYFDEKGVTNGILYTDKITFPAYAEDGSSVPLVPYINYKINDIPPDWAYSMQFYLTKENTQYIFWESLSVDKSEAEYIYFEVTSFIANANKKPTTAKVLSYTFQDGDRMRVIKNSVTGAVYDYTFDSAIEGLVVDPTINSTPITGNREFIKIKNIAPFTATIDGTQNYIIELYRPAQQSANTSNQVYYEFGQQYNIIDPTLPTRRHSGMVTDQTVGVTPAEYNFYEGDAYFRSRTIASREGAGYATFNVMDRNFVDFYISAISSVDGRPNIIDLNARRAYYSTLIRHSEAYQANTNINGLNRFYAKNFDEYDYSFGDALALKIKNRQLIVFQKYKIGAVSLFSSIGKDQNGLAVVFNTDKLLNPIQYYVGDFGIGTCPESIASFNYAIYGCDNIKGKIWRLSNDGLTDLSSKYKMNSWANDNLILRTGDYKIYGAFDQRLDNYILSAEAVGGNLAQTLTFDEQNNRFESFVSFFPEMMVTLGTTLISFKNGVLWTHDDDGYYNNFFGVQYDSYITPVFNKAEIAKKTFISIEEIASQAWYSPEIITTSNSFGSTKQRSGLIEADFEELEGNYNAAFLNDVNSIGGLIEGDSLKGNLMSIQLRATFPDPPNNLLVSLSMVTVKSINSPLNNDR